MVVTIYYTLILFCVVERTLVDLSALYLWAWSCLIIERVVLLLLPTMRSETSGLQNAPFFVLTNEGARLPILTKFMSIVVKDVRLSSEVLPVVSVVALSLIVLLVERTPLCLEIELVVVGILLHSVNYASLQISLRVSK